MYKRGVAAVCALMSAVANAQIANDFTFTYQGTLDDAGSPAQGVYDFRFRLYDAASGGAQVGTTLCADNVAVTDGLFTAALQFINAYDGYKRFLEIDVRPGAAGNCSNSTGYTTLAPRQELTETPYSVRSQFTGLAYTADRLGGFSWTYYLDASNLATGTLADGRLGANVARTNAPQTFVAAQTFSSGSFLLRNAANTFSTLIDASSASAPRSILFPDASGTVITTGNLSAITATGTITSGVWNGTPISVARGGTGADLSATGGAGRVLKQTSPGGAITVGLLQTSDLPNLAGDVNGPGGTNTISSLQGQTLSMGAAALFDALIWNGASWSPGSPMMGGDVLGAANNASVQRIQGRPVLGFAPNAGDALVWLAGSWGPAQLTLAGDVVGPSGGTTVTRLYGRALSSTAPSGNQLLWYNGDTAQWQPRSFSAADMPHVHAPGDLTGPVPISLGGTGATDPASALVNLGGAGVGMVNNFVQANAFNGPVSVFNTLTATGFANFSAGISASVGSGTNVPLSVSTVTGASADVQQWRVGAGLVGRLTPAGAIVLSSTATATEFNYASAMAGTCSVNECAFVERSGIGVRCGQVSGGAVPIANSTLGLVAPVNLPEGAVVTGVHFFVLDNDAAVNLSSLRLLRHAFAGGYSVISTASTTGANAAIQDIAVTGLSHIVNNSNASYEVVAAPSATWPGGSTALVVMGVRIDYTLARPAR